MGRDHSCPVCGKGGMNDPDGKCECAAQPYHDPDGNLRHTRYGLPPDPNCSYRAEHHRIAELQKALALNAVARDQLRSERDEARAARGEAYAEGLKRGFESGAQMEVCARYEEALERIANFGPLYRNQAVTHLRTVARQALADQEPPTDEQERP